ncbi:hypothetical protein DIPPA_12842 [Diplonema papillatum]|nr:hypothetical protein DIPPA_12842 [Diplonema papillatum]
MARFVEGEDAELGRAAMHADGSDVEFGRRSHLRAVVAEKGAEAVFDAVLHSQGPSPAVLHCLHSIVEHAPSVLTDRRSYTLVSVLLSAAGNLHLGSPLVSQAVGHNLVTCAAASAGIDFLQKHSRGNNFVAVLPILAVLSRIAPAGAPYTTYFEALGRHT